MTPQKKQKTIMKTKNMLWAALSMTAALVMTACTNDDNIVETPAAPQAEVKTIPYSVTVGQGGDATTRATVDDDMKTLRFAEGDKLYIASGDLKGILTLKKGDEGKTSGATFEGTISYTGAAPTDDIWLNATLVGTSNKNIYIVNDKVAGVISPSAYCNNVKEAVEKFSCLIGGTYYDKKEFTLEQTEAFLNFEITFEDGTAAGTTLTTVVSNSGLYPDPYCSADVTTRTEGGKVVAKFVLPVSMGVTLSGATVKMGDKAALTINDATLEGKVYNVKRTYAAAAPAATLLSTIASDYTAKDGETLTGTLGSNVKISIADGAKVKLKDVTINGVNDGSYAWAGITCEGDATITLEGTNTVKGFHLFYPGIYVPEGKTLTIEGEGSLDASGNGPSTGIGGGFNMNCGDIVINGGNITATGGFYSAGIGGGGVNYGDEGVIRCGKITINGGTVTATGGECAAGIGCGYNGASNDITITGGTVTATGGEYAAGIGSGEHGSCGAITISGGTVTATAVKWAAGIGGGNENGTSGDITITSGVTQVTATKGSNCLNSIGEGDGGAFIIVIIDDYDKVTQK